MVACHTVSSVSAVILLTCTGVTQVTKVRNDEPFLSSYGPEIEAEQVRGPAQPQSQFLPYRIWLAVCFAESTQQGFYANFKCSKLHCYMGLLCRIKRMVLEIQKDTRL